MHTYNPRVLKNLVMKHISPFIVEDAVEIREWRTRAGRHTSPGVIEAEEGSEGVIKAGEHWSAGYDDTRYFACEVTVPEHFAGRTVRLSLDFGGEAIVRVNGKIAGAVSSRQNSGWVGRNEIVFAEPFSGGEALSVEAEAAVDCGGFCDYAMAGETSMEYTVRPAYLQLINDEAEAFYFDATTAWDACEQSPDPVTAKRIYNVLDTAAHIPDYDAGKARFYEAMPEARRVLSDGLAAIGFSMPGEVILTGHSHLDVAWLWTVKEITRKTARTFANTLALMDRYPAFRFTQSQAALYAFMKEHYPEIFERVKEKVKNGQWEITGNTWVEADTNLASGESLIRQLLVGRAFFLKEFGVSSDVYWLPDCFGFTAALPQIIARSGMKYFYTSKLQNNDTNEFPMSVFRWRGHSGHEVLAYMQKCSYNSAAEADYIANLRARNLQADLVPATMGNFGYGDGGGGCTWRMFERVERFRDMPGMPRTVNGTAAAFFAGVEAAREELPVWDGEMYYENHRGTFTSQAFVKANNRRGEYLLRRLEFLSVVSGADLREELSALWRLLLTNQFHDILPGSSIHEVYEQTRLDYAELFRRGGRIEKQILRRLSASVGRGNTVVVWNFLPRPVTGPVTVRVPGSVGGVFDLDGVAMPASVSTDEQGSILTFIARDVPPMGCKCFAPDTVALGISPVTARPDLLENEFLRVSVGEDGSLLSVWDKENGREVLSAPGNVLTVSHDKPVHESAWNLENDYRLHSERLTAESVSVTERSSVCGSVTAVYRFGENVVTQRMALYAGSKRLDFETHAVWNAREKVLKASFPLELRARYSAFEVAHGAVERPTFANNPYERAMFECCAHKWVDLGENDYGVSLLNDCKYGHDVTDNVMSITLLRGPVCPDPTGDVGEHRFTYSLYPHAGGWYEAGTVFEAQKLNEGLIGLYNPAGSDTAAGGSWMSLDTPGAVLDAVKPAEDGDGVIVRVYEAERKRRSVTLSLPFAPETVYETNLMEENERRIPSVGRKLTFELAPFEVKTFRLAAALPPQ